MSQQQTVIYHGVAWTFRRAPLYCPRCGHYGMWLEGNDFYVGATGHCIACQHTHQCAGEFAAFGDFERAAAAVLAEQEET